MPVRISAFGDGGNEQSVRGLFVQPSKHLQLWAAPHELGDDVRIQNYHPQISIEPRGVSHGFSRGYIQLHTAEGLE